jgi:RND family efflux transporter MFP subunit
VPVVVATKQAIEEGGTVTGEFRARTQADLSFRVSGKIVERFVDVGDVVTAGQVLARLEADEQQADLEVATANLEAAVAQQTQARLAFERQTNLFQRQVTTKAALDRAQEALSTAEGSTRSAEAQLETARDALSYTELKADAPGVVTARNAEVGQVAQAAQAIFTLAQDGPRDAVFEVVETLFLGREVQPVVSVSLLSTPSVSVEAKVHEVSPTIDATTGTVRVKVALANEASMPLGAAVAGSFKYKPQDMIQLPWSAMASKGGDPAVWIVDPVNSKVTIRPIKVANYGTERFSVSEGVAEGDVIVASGIKFLRPGETVAQTGTSQ